MPLEIHVRTTAGSQRLVVDGAVSIGRSPDSAVRVDDIDVSRRHGMLVVDSPASGVYTDLGSANGTKINGKDLDARVPARVQAGDTIALGSSLITLSGGSPQAAGTGGPRETVLAPSPPAARPGATMVAAAPAPQLEVTTSAGTQVVSLSSDLVRIGRAAENDIRVDNDVVSREHLVLRRTASGYRAENLSRTNGIQVRGQRVESHDLVSGDVLEIASEVSLRYLATPAPAADPRAVTTVTKPLLVGRDASCDVRIDVPTVSKVHARISPTGGGQLTIEDLGSTNGTYVNGVPLQKGVVQALKPADIVLIGPVRLDLTAGAVAADSGRDFRLTAIHLNQRVSPKLNLLQDISVVVEPREFIAVVGVSGSGKSTLLNALSGLRPATGGDVRLNQTSLYANYQAFRTTLGFVPQDDILHKDLPVGRALAYTADLRLPDDVTPDERTTQVESVIATLGLKERRETPVGSLSGGQRKRVSIGAELLTQPGVFFLDEATSGLDPGTESQLMRLLRRLADDGHTILLITHATKNVMLCDQVLFLARGGHLAYFGPPDEALTYFGVSDFDGIYEKLEGEKSPDEWGALYRQSGHFRQFVAGRLGSDPAAIAAAAPPAERSALPAARTSSAFRQWRVLSTRYFDLIRRDRVNLLLLFLLAPILSLIDLVAWPRDVLDPLSGDGSTAMTMMFLGSLIPFLIGSLSSVREIVKEAAIYARERAVSLKIWPYLGSKMAIGALFAIYHGLILVIAKALFLDFPEASAAGYLAIYLTLVLAVMSGVMWALLISTLTRKEEQAMMLIIGLIVVQVVFSGGLVNLDDLGIIGTVFGGVTSTAWAFKAIVAAFGVTSSGCTGDFAACDVPGVPGIESAESRALTFGGVDNQFSAVFNAELLTCWVAMAAIIAGLAVVLYVLQKRKDTL
ncbi:MAG: FHA domain-containing protein [Dehalococcoidia bacterium]